jgi:hypothetical protein
MLCRLPMLLHYGHVGVKVVKQLAKVLLFFVITKKIINKIFKITTFLYNMVSKKHTFEHEP